MKGERDIALKSKSRSRARIVLILVRFSRTKFLHGQKGLGSRQVDWGMSAGLLTAWAVRWVRRRSYRRAGNFRSWTVGLGFKRWPA